MPVVYTPSFCMLIQGEKEVALEDQSLRYGVAQYLVVSVDLPVVGRVTKATKEEPYLCFAIDLDPAQISELVIQTKRDFTATPPSRGVFVGNVDQGLWDCVYRIGKLLDTPQDIPLLAPMTLRELYYRLVTGEFGALVSQIAIKDSSMQRVAKVIHLLKTNLSKSIRVEEMADLASMSPSSFHQHFKEVTAMSPLQYQKRLRLLEARRILLTEDSDAASASYRVGYESPSQFSREYSRMFGASPIRDIEMLQSQLGVG
jgi:AraC-like DNA-binding protein